MAEVPNETGAMIFENGMFWRVGEDGQHYYSDSPAPGTIFWSQGEYWQLGNDNKHYWLDITGNSGYKSNEDLELEIYNANLEKIRQEEAARQQMEMLLADLNSSLSTAKVPLRQTLGVLVLDGTLGRNAGGGLEVRVPYDDSRPMSFQLDKSTVPTRGLADYLDAADFASNQMIGTPVPLVAAAGAAVKLGANSVKGILAIEKILSKAEKTADMAEVGWKVGDDIYKLTSKGNNPSWSTIRSRFWKNEAANPSAVERYGADNVERMNKGLAPQRYNPDKGGMESMELSHEPTPRRSGGTEVVPRWPQEHAEVDPFRFPGY